MSGAEKASELANEESKLRSQVLAKTLKVESLRYLRVLRQELQEARTTQEVGRAAYSPFTAESFNLVLKELCTSQLKLCVYESGIADDEILSKAGVSFQEFVMETQEALCLMLNCGSLENSGGDPDKCAEETGDAVVDFSGVKSAAKQLYIKNSVQDYLNGSAPLRAKLLEYAVKQGKTILTDYLFTMQLFGE
ncbi:MAG: hypothetical protein K2X27_19770 [Candidatus Obscuribacterales bacterium]|nr:hypothetical protein [Candidatus Obscuribacterales bacterium]